MNDKHICAIENAPKFLNWIQTRGGVACWKSINLSNPSASWSSPATIKLADCDASSPEVVAALGRRICPTCFGDLELKPTPCGGFFCLTCKQPVLLADILIPYPKPNWQTENVPSRIIKDAADILVETDREVKRFKVYTRQSGLSIKLTDASSRKVNKAVEEAGDGAGYCFDYDTHEAVITVPATQVSLAEWKP